MIVIIINNNMSRHIDYNETMIYDNDNETNHNIIVCIYIYIYIYIHTSSNNNDSKSDNNDNKDSNTARPGFASGRPRRTRTPCRPS